MPMFLDRGKPDHVTGRISSIGTAFALHPAKAEPARSMGVDTKIFALASQAGPSEAITPSTDTLLALNVINEGSKPVNWTIESVPGAIYLKGEQQTALGMNKFILICPARHPMELYAIFDAAKNTDEVMGWQTNWLFVDGNQVQIDDELFEKRSTTDGSIYRTVLTTGCCQQSLEREQR